MIEIAIELRNGGRNEDRAATFSNADTAVIENIHEAATSLAELPRLNSGKFPDDVAILLADASA